VIEAAVAAFDVKIYLKKKSGQAARCTSPTEAVDHESGGGSMPKCPGGAFLLALPSIAAAAAVSAGSAGIELVLGISVVNDLRRVQRFVQFSRFVFV
jgi:hypothetical protein